MTQVYDENNVLVPVTVIEAGPCPVTQVKTTESDGYNAIQIGFGERRKSRVRRPEAGRSSNGRVPQQVREVRCQAAPEAEVGEVLTVETFTPGEKVDVIGITKGRGFQGVVKRWGFSGGPASHGSMFHRRGGSYGANQWPGEVQKGKKMPGHMGTDRRTVQNLRIVKVLPEKNILLVKGSIPGANGSSVVVRTAKKVRKSS